MSGEENKALVMRYLREAWEQGNPSVIDDLCTSGFTYHVIEGSRHVQGDREELKKRIVHTHGYARDLQATVQDILAEGDRVALRYTYDAMVGGKPIKLFATMFLQFVAGKINEYWYFDQEVTSA